MNGKHPYPNLPTNSSTWNSLIEPAKDAYWNARREDRTENDALLCALDAYTKAYEDTLP